MAFDQNERARDCRAAHNNKVLGDVAGAVLLVGSVEDHQREGLDVCEAVGALDQLAQLLLLAFEFVEEAQQALATHSSISGNDSAHVHVP